VFYKILFLALTVFYSSFALANDAQNLVDNAQSLKISEEAKQLLGKLPEIENMDMYQEGLNMAKSWEANRKHFKIGNFNKEDSQTLSNKVNLNRLVAKYNNKLKVADNKSAKLNKLLIFISSSMPKESLTALDEQAKRAGGLLVLRGLINGSFKDTAAYITSLSDKGISAIIDPRLFAMFNVGAVPTFVLKPDDSNPCFDDKCHYTPIHDRVSGNITLEYALELISQNGATAKDVASSYLINLRGQM